MTFYTCAALAVLLIVGFAGAMLPFVSVWDHRLAAARRRSLYDKAAGQTESFTAALQIILALALGADLLAGGWINRLMTGPWAFVWECLVIASAVAALCAAAVLFVRRAGKMAFGVLSGLAATLSSCLLCVLAWGFCLGALTAGTGNEEEAVQSFLVLMAGLHSLGFVFFAAFSLFLGLTSAYALALCWHILCRNRDDFGRDYYTFTLSMRSRQAFCAGLLLTVSAAAMFWLTPVVRARSGAASLRRCVRLSRAHRWYVLPASCRASLVRRFPGGAAHAEAVAGLPCGHSAGRGRVLRARPRVAWRNSYFSELGSLRPYLFSNTAFEKTLLLIAWGPRGSGINPF